MTLTLTSDDLESHIVVNVSSTLTNKSTTIWFVAAMSLIVDVTDGRTDVRTDVHFYRVYCHLSGDDLKLIYGHK